MILIIGLVLLLVAAVSYGVAHLPVWFWHPLGLCAGTPHQVMLCKGYNAWSGIFSDVSEVTLAVSAVTLLVGAYRHLNCHTHRCPRRGKHLVAGGTYKVCSRCLGRIDPEHAGEHTLEHIARHHHAHKTKPA